MALGSHLSDVLVRLTLDEAPRHRERPEQVAAGGRGMWYGCVSSHGVSWAQAGPSTALGTWLAAWPRSPGMGRRTLFRQRPLGSFGHTGPRGRSSVGFHGASAPGAAPIIINRCMFCWEASHRPSRGDNGLPPLKWVSLHPPPPLSSFGEDFFLPRPKSHSLGPLPNP